MKVYLSADIEGITGVSHWDETSYGKEGYDVAREQMTVEVLAACEGALQAGATDIWVKDAHGSGRNLLAAKLPPEARLIRGWSGHPFLMVQELDDSFAGLMLVGYHSRAGGDGNPLAHSVRGSLRGIALNGQLVSEFLLHTYAGATVGVPTVFVSGDQGLCDDVAELNGQITTVAVKQGIGNSTLNLQPALAASRIRQGVARALAGDLAQCQVSLPEQFAVDVTYRLHYEAYRMGFYPGAQQIGPFSVRLTSNSYYEVMRFLLFAV
jgi:D-amino peptidase